MRALPIVLLAVLLAGCGTRAASDEKPAKRASRALCRVGPPAYRICGIPTGGPHSRPSIERLGDDGSWDEVAGPVGYQPAPGDWVGHWVSVKPSPDGKTLLAQWSGECESPEAYFVPATGGRPWHATGKSDRMHPPPLSAGLGWTKDGRARVRVFGSDCGDSRPPRVYLIDPASGRRTLEQPDCRIERGYRLCPNFAQGDFHSTIERRAASGRWRIVAGPPRPQPGHGQNGQWVEIFVSPDGETLLAQWGSGCEVPNAFFVPVSGGRPRPVTGEGDWRKAPMSRASGWAGDGRARVELLSGGCGPDFERPGLYLIDASSGRGTFVRPLPQTP